MKQKNSLQKDSKFHCVSEDKLLGWPWAQRHPVPCSQTRFHLRFLWLRYNLNPKHQCSHSNEELSILAPLVQKHHWCWIHLLLPPPHHWFYPVPAQIQPDPPPTSPPTPPPLLTYQVWQARWNPAAELAEWPLFYNSRSLSWQPNEELQGQYIGLGWTEEALNLLPLSQFPNWNVTTNLMNSFLLNIQLNLAHAQKYSLN